MNSIFTKKTLYSFFLCLIISILCLASERIVPFGNNTLAVMDADIQYLDFFAYLKDVLEGKASIEYSFAKQLGSTPIAVFSYYLTSPFNLLVYFFQKSQLHLFFSLLVVLKLSLSAFSMAIFLSERVKNLSSTLTVALSLSYAFMQYNLSQASNIMWLDGVYLLPLLLLGVYQVADKQGILLLAISTAFTMIFNWYIGLINLVFSGFYFLYEYSLTQNKSWRDFIFTALKYVAGAVIGLLICAILFVPTYIELKNGRGSVDWWLLGAGFEGNIVTLFSSFTFGAESRYGSTALESTSLVLAGVLALFTHLSSKQRVNYVPHILFFVFVILILYWKPFIFLFSLFKYVSSYWCRYSHLVGFSLILLAAIAYNNEVSLRKLIKACFIFFVGALAVQLVNHSGDLQRIYATAFCCICFLVIYCYRHTRLFNMALISLCVVEILFSFHMLAKKQDLKYWYSYTENLENYANTLSEDNGFSRVSKLQTRRISEDYRQANYNEGLGFGFNTFISYTSSPDNRQRDLFHALGYNIMGPNMNIVNTSILPVDALFAVREILDNSYVAATLQLPKGKAYQHFSVYENPYALPLIFNYPMGELEPKFKSDNPFLNINGIYSYLLNRDVQLFTKVESTVNYAPNKMIVDVSTYIGRGVAYYAYIDTPKHLNGKLFLDGKLLTGYSTWLAPRVILLPGSQNERTQIVFEAKDLNKGQIKSTEVYQLNLKLLKEITDELKSINHVVNTQVSNGNIRFEVSKNNSGKVFLSVPYDKQWTIKRNGEEIQAEPIFGALTAIPLQKEQRNVIEMSYSVAGLKTGVSLTALGFFLLCFIVYFSLRTKVVLK